MSAARAHRTRFVAPSVERQHDDRVQAQHELVTNPAGGRPVGLPVGRHLMDRDAAPPRPSVSELVGTRDTPVDDRGRLEIGEFPRDHPGTQIVAPAAYQYAHEPMVPDRRQGQELGSGSV